MVSCRQPPIVQFRSSLVLSVHRVVVVLMAVSSLCFYVLAARALVVRCAGNALCFLGVLKKEVNILT